MAASMTLEQRTDFFKKVLAKMGLPVTANRLTWLLAQSEVENTAAKNNPLATTWNMASVDPGQTNFNNIGVRNYSTAEIGATATAKTLLQTKYYPYTIEVFKADTLPTDPTINTARIQKEFQIYGGAAGYWDALKNRSTSAKILDFVKKNFAPISAGVIVAAVALWLLLRK